VALQRFRDNATLNIIFFTVRLHIMQRSGESRIFLTDKGKGKRGFVWHLVVNTPLRRSGMTRVLKGSHSFTCTPRVHPLTE